MSGQNFLFSPKENVYEFRRLRIEDGRLLFYVENQGCYQWATLPEGDDPPVFGRFDDRDAWEPEGVSLSEHLILVCLFEAIHCHSLYGASSSWLEEDKLNEIIKAIPVLSIGAWRWPGPGRFCAGRGAFVHVCKYEVRGETGYSVWIGAKTARPLRFLEPLIDSHWEYVAL